MSNAMNSLSSSEKISIPCAIISALDAEVNGANLQAELAPTLEAMVASGWNRYAANATLTALVAGHR